MLAKHSGQFDIFNSMIYEKLIPKNHLLLKIEDIIDFSFVYDITREYYSQVGRNSYDPVIMFKLCLLEYIYVLSERKVVERTQTDVVFRWFLGLTLDDTTISYFRANRLGDKPFEEVFNTIVQKCIDADSRVAHKSPGKRKAGYKNHIIVD